jgi:hypothetical protein
VTATPEEAIAIGAPPRRLDGRLALPATARSGAVVCHPHPLYGGSMDNPVVVATAAALAGAGRATLRFDFGGVGRSQGGHGGGPDEVRDVQNAAASLRARLPTGAPLVLVGYSFGAWAALTAAGETPDLAHVVAIAPPIAFGEWEFLRALRVPVTVIVGDRDQYCDATRVATLRTGLPVQVLRHADHFLAGREDEVAAAVVAALA